MDSIDRGLIYELDKNARKPLAEIARKLRVSPDLIESRLRKLEDNGTVERYGVHINHRRIGKFVYKAYLKMQGLKSSRDRAVETCAKLPNLVWLAETYGHWDVCFSCAARSPGSFQKTLHKLLSKFSIAVADQDVTTTTEVIRYPRKYLVGRYSKRAFMHLRTKEHVELDDADKKLIKTLERYGRDSFVSLGERLGVSPAKVRYRMNRLEETGVISGYRAHFSSEMLGIQIFKILIERLDYSQEFESKFRRFCGENKHIIYLGSQLGRYSLELDVEVRGLGELNTVLDSIREEFDGDFRSMETLLLKSDFVRNIAL